MDFRIRLKSEHKEKLANQLLQEIQTALAAKEELHSRIDDWNSQYEGILPPKDEPWQGCSNLHIPLTSWQTDTIASHLYRTVFSSEPVIRCEPEEGGDEDGARQLERWLQHIQTRVALKGGKGKELCIAAAKGGTSLGKLTHETWIDPLWGVDEETGEVVEKRLTRKGITLSFVPLKDFVMCPAEALSIREAVAVGDRKKMRLSEIRFQERVGRYDKDSAKAVEESASSQIQEADETQETIGIEPDRQGHKQFESWDRWEMIWALPVVERSDSEGGSRWAYAPDDDKAIERDCLVTLIDASKPIITRVMLYPWFHGRRHYIPFRILPREGQFYGRSVPEVLKQLQDELNTEHNQRIDYRTLVLKTPILVRRGANITDAQGKTHIVWAPGHPMVVDDINNDAKQMELRPMGADSYKEEEQTISFSERALGVTESKLGRTERGRKTLGEVQITESMGNVRFDDMVEAFQGCGDRREGWGLRELAYQLIGLSWQFEREEMERVLDDGAQVLKLGLEDVIGAYDYVPHGNTMVSNVNVRREQAALMYAQLIQNPIVAQNLVRLWNVTKDLLDAFDVKGHQSLIGTEQEAEQMMMAMQQAAQQAQAQAQAEGEQAQGQQMAGEIQKAIKEAEEQGYLDGQAGLADIPEDDLLGSPA